MVAPFFSVLVLVAVVSIAGDFVMRVRLTQSDFSKDKWYWWRCSGEDLTKGYEELFPTSRLPLYRRLAFWFVVGCSSVLLVSILLKSN